MSDNHELMNLLNEFLFIMHNPKMDNSHWFNAEKKLKEAIKMLASEPESKQKGKWIFIFCGYNDYSGYTRSVWKCPVCKELFYENSRFCPDCGKPMEV